MFGRLTTLARTVGSTLRRWAGWFHAIQDRERKYLLSELMLMQEAMPLLMKQRNGFRWDKADRKRLRTLLRRLSRLSPYLLPLILPGGFLFLPLVAWWLDRRRQKRVQEEQEQEQESCAG